MIFPWVFQWKICETPRKLDGKSMETPRKLDGKSMETPRKLDGKSMETPRKLDGKLDGKSHEHDLKWMIFWRYPIGIPILGHHHMESYGFSHLS